MKFDILNRFSGKVQFTAEISCDEETSRYIKIGLAVKLALKNGAYLCGAYLRDADLGGADLCGAYLRDADLGGAYLGGAYLRDAYLCGAYLCGADLGGAYLGGAYLRDADLCGAYLRDADLGGADLGGADLRGADLGGDPTEIPVIEKIDAKILAAIESAGTLDMSDWHTCETTHCRSGWAIHLAGEAGYALEKKHGPWLAGTIIYYASRPDQPAPNFYASTADALADIRKCAAEQLAEPSK